MNWLNALPARAQGAVTLGFAVAVAGLGLLVARLLSYQFYPVVFPCAGLLAPIGLFQLAFGYSRDDFTHRRVPRGLLQGLLAGCVLGVWAGLEANKALFGVRW